MMICNHLSENNAVNIAVVSNGMSCYHCNNKESIAACLQSQDSRACPAGQQVVSFQHFNAYDDIHFEGQTYKVYEIQGCAVDPKH